MPFVVPFLLGVVYGQPASVPATPDVSVVEAAALAQRRAVQSAEFQYSSRWEAPRSKLSKLVAETGTFWLDKSHLRVDSVRRSTGDEKGTRTVECYDGLRPQTYLIFRDSPNLAVSVRPRAEAERGRFVWAIYDPRLLGYASYDTGRLTKARLDDVVGSADRDPPTIAGDRFADTDCWVVRYRSKTAGNVAVWYDKDRGFHPVRIQSGGVGYEKELVVTLQQAGEQLWFPRTIKFKELVNGEAQISQTIEITAARLNQPVPAERFTLTDMNIPEGRIISDATNRKLSGVWQGGKIIPYDVARRQWKEQGRLPEPEPVALAQQPRARYWLYAMAALLTAGAALFIRRAFRPRVTTT